MATVIRLQRGGRKKRPFYSIVVMDSRSRRDGAFIEKLGYYDPVREPIEIKLDLDRVKAWTSTGARVSPRVESLIKHIESAHPRVVPSVSNGKVEDEGDASAAVSMAADDSPEPESKGSPSEVGEEESVDDGSDTSGKESDA